ncbi:hypothetical protein C3F09_04685 [candidate division GN15 bacterium]|uniref:Efflux RND transporter periplasmic adaptor subunit n=1 Tax=candidate division GN15 bacterium TaxID=2072418 RepID=A0A855X7R0_9BACT|nr:MAG: hypothetical protein C3F09_04685 [candidate division GN15 bacterium]
MKTRAKFAILVVLLMLVAAALFRIVSYESRSEVHRQPPALVKVEAPLRQTITNSLPLTGDVLPILHAQVFARVYGNLESTEADIGQYVRANQLLARIDTTELAQQYRQADATYRNTLEVYNRAKPLMEQNLIAKQDYDDAATNMEVAKENFEAAKTRLGYADITAPFSGYITRRYLDAGALLTSTNATLFDLDDLDTVKVIVNVLEKDVPSISLGMTSEVTVDAFPGRVFVGAIARMADAIDLNTRTMPVQINIANHEHLLKPGMFATVSIIVNRKTDVLTVPTQALLKDAEGPYVLVADKGKARRAAVTTGTEQQSRTEILTGLNASDSVITTGQQFTHDGGPITIQP